MSSLREKQLVDQQLGRSQDNSSSGQNELRGFQDRHRDDYSIMWLTMKPKHFEREVRRSRHLSASINVEGRAHCECQVLDISTHGAKVVAGTPSAVPDRSEPAFFEGVQSRVCEVVWATRQDAWRQVHLLNGGDQGHGENWRGIDNASCARHYLGATILWVDLRNFSKIERGDCMMRGQTRPRCPRGLMRIEAKKRR
jgi:hypothetical protein